MQQIHIPVRVTETIHGEDALKAILQGVKTLHDPVASTLGASGRTVIIEDKYGNPKPTKDGVTVAKAIVPLYSEERMGSEVLKQASLKTGDEAGDGTTTATVLAKAIIDGGVQLLRDKKINYTDFNRGMQEAYNVACGYLEERVVSVNLDNVENVATISANNDAELGGLIAKAFKQAGEHGVVLMEPSSSPYTEIVKTEGFELQKGYVNEIFVNNPERDRVEYDDCLVLISNSKIERIEQIERFVGFALQNKKAITIVSEMEDEVLAILGTNRAKHKFKFNVVHPSHFGVRRKDILNDLGIATGALVFDPDTGDNFDGIDDDGIEDALGWCKQVITDRHKTVFFIEDNDAVKAHVRALKVRLKDEGSETERKFLQERISKISSSVVTIKVGASSEAEQSEIADRVDDAIHATRAALEEGIVAGGGVALHNVSTHTKKGKFLNSAQEAGYDVVMEAMRVPLKTILSNGDIEYDHVKHILTQEGYGVNVKNAIEGDMVEMGIIDPVKVTKSALKNAISAASTLLSTSTVIVNLRKA